MSVLLLRPEHKLEASCKTLSEAGIDCVGVALMRVTQGPDSSQTLQDYFTSLNASAQQQIVVIFTSQSAVNYAFEPSFDWPASIQTYAVGLSTAEALARNGIKAHVPDDPTSEGLLAVLQDVDLHNAHILLCKGVGGRDKLQTELAPKATSFTELALYQRQPLTQAEPTRPWQHAEIRCIVATSGEILEAAFSQFDPDWLRSLPWVVVSQRLEQLATTLGIETIFQSAGARDQQLIEAIQRIWSAK